MRGRDSHILTVDSEVFISDERFHSQIQKLSNLWILKVKATSSTPAIYFSKLNNRFSQPLNLQNNPIKQIIDKANNLTKRYDMTSGSEQTWLNLQLSFN